MSISVEKNGPIATVILNRPERRNAVDRATAQTLADAFREFEADDEALAGVLRVTTGRLESKSRKTSKTIQPKSRRMW